MRVTRDEVPRAGHVLMGLETLPRTVRHAMVGVVPVSDGWDLYTSDVTAELMNSDLVGPDTAQVVLAARVLPTGCLLAVSS